MIHKRWGRPQPHIYMGACFFDLLFLGLGPWTRLWHRGLAFGSAFRKRELLRDYEDCTETMIPYIELDCLHSMGAMDDLIRHDMDTTSVYEYK